MFVSLSKGVDFEIVFRFVTFWNFFGQFFEFFKFFSSPVGKLFLFLHGKFFGLVFFWACVFFSKSNGKMKKNFLPDRTELYVAWKLHSRCVYNCENFFISSIRSRDMIFQIFSLFTELRKISPKTKKLFPLDKFKLNKPAFYMEDPFRIPCYKNLFGNKYKRNWIGSKKYPTWLRLYRRCQSWTNPRTFL